MSHVVWYRVPLVCTHCGSSTEGDDIHCYTSGFGRDSIDTRVKLGSVLELDLADFADGFLTLTVPGDGRVRVIEQWRCPTCKWVQWAYLDFEQVDDEHYRVAAARAVALTATAFDGVHYVSRKLDLWVESHPGPATDEIMAVVGSLMPWLERESERSATCALAASPETARISAIVLMAFGSCSARSTSLQNP